MKVNYIDIDEVEGLRLNNWQERKFYFSSGLQTSSVYYFISVMTIFNMQFTYVL